MARKAVKKVAPKKKDKEMSQAELKKFQQRNFGNDSISRHKFNQS